SATWASTSATARSSTRRTPPPASASREYPRCRSPVPADRADRSQVPSSMTPGPDQRPARLRRAAVAVAAVLTLVAIPVVAWRWSEDPTPAPSAPMTLSTIGTAGATGAADSGADRTGQRSVQGAAVVRALIEAI